MNSAGDQADQHPWQYYRVDTGKARLYYADGTVITYDDQRLAYAVWLALPKGIRVAFRGAGDQRPVYPWDFIQGH